MRSSGIRSAVTALKMNKAMFSLSKQSTDKLIQSFEFRIYFKKNNYRVAQPVKGLLSRFFSFNIE